MSDCILVKADPYRDGYGTVHRKGRTQSAHRRAYEDEHGPIPDGMVVRHKCDVRNCVNLDHLELGTAADNQQDSIRRGRMAGMKLTQTDVEEIRSSTDTQRVLAKRYGVSQPRISKIKTGEAYRTIGHIK